MLLHERIRNILIGLTSVTDIVAVNTRFSATQTGRYCVRPGDLDADDRFPAIVIAVPQVAHDHDLNGNIGLSTAALHVRCVAPILSDAYSLHHAAAFDSGDPLANSDGLHKYRDLDTGIQFIALESTDEFKVPRRAGSDETLHVVEGQYTVQYWESAV